LFTTTATSTEAPLKRRNTLDALANPKEECEDNDDHDFPNPLKGNLRNLVSSACSSALATRTTTLKKTSTTTVPTVKATVVDTIIDKVTTPATTIVVVTTIVATSDISVTESTTSTTTTTTATEVSSTSTAYVTTYTGIIEVFSGSTSLGYIAPDPNYWTPLLTPDPTAALTISFQLPQGATSGSQLNFNQLNDNRGALLALVVGRDSTSSDIGSGNFNYLYLDPAADPGTPPGASPESVPSYFATSSGLDKQSETSVWSVNLVDGTITCQWINTDSSKLFPIFVPSLHHIASPREVCHLHNNSGSPATVTFVQSNHLYAGGDANAFHSRFPAPVTTVTLQFVPT
jgi:hypothetical protein